MRSQLTGTVNVEVDAAPQVDLNKILDEIRQQYEAITDKHRRDQEAWFNDQVKLISHKLNSLTPITK